MTTTKGTDKYGRPAWVMKWHVFGMTLALARGFALKPRPRGSGNTDKQRRQRNHMANCHEKKPSLYAAGGGKCHICGQPYKQRQLQIHHVLPMERFPELGSTRANLVLVCPHCHRELHNNPVLASNEMDRVATSLNIDWRARYNDKVQSV